MEGSVHAQVHLDSYTGAPSSSSGVPPLSDFHGVLAKSPQLSKAASLLSLEIDADLASFVYDGDKVCSSNGPSAKALILDSSPCEQGRLPIIKIPIPVDATITMPPDSDIKPPMTSLK
ncbi:hypothetical protein Nepgr_026067 [Nepenthes gracilis]|uniref:Uncharacterized protein n=1 Tax=Nepenthes gracilis TaxID=150966 RepID=A0AAD3Y1Q4_NEPGR|nr:hypothetical protein Nepgr_026067 [Nepenthes gracilis]